MISNHLPLDENDDNNSEKSDYYQKKKESDFFSSESESESSDSLNSNTINDINNSNDDDEDEGGNENDREGNNNNSKVQKSDDKNFDDKNKKKYTRTKNKDNHRKHINENIDLKKYYIKNSGLNINNEGVLNYKDIFMFNNFEDISNEFKKKFLYNNELFYFNIEKDLKTSFIDNRLKLRKKRLNDIINKLRNINI